MEVVCNSTVLIALSRVRHLWILGRLFESITIPLAVYDEVAVKGSGKPGAKDLAEAKWIQVKAIENVSRVEELSSTLHRGEAETIVLAEENDADLIVLDDNCARRTARARGLNVTGTLAILLLAKQRGIVTHLGTILNDLRSAGFYMGGEYYEILKDAGEN